MHSANVKLSPKARVLAAVLSAAVFLLPARSLAKETAAPGAEADRTNIVSSLRRGDAIFASTQTGLYQGSVTNKTWRKLDAPAEMKPGGTFIQQDPAALIIAYYHTLKWPDIWTKIPDNPEIPSDLFVSKDGGKTWAQTSKVSRIISVYIHPSGVFLSTQETSRPDPPVRPNTTGRVFASNDFGATWKDVSGNLPAKIIFNRFIRDPLYPNKIAVTGYDPAVSDVLLSRGPRLYEADVGVYQWTAAYSENVFGLMDKIHNLESSWQYGHGDQYDVIIQPTLANFFTPAFLDRDPDINPENGGPFVFAFQLETEKTVYTFRKDEPKVIPVTVEFLAQHPKAKLLDKKDEAVFWRVGMVSYGSKQGFEPRFLQFQEQTAPVAKKKAAATLRDADLMTVTPDPGHPYKRGIDLAKLHDFSKPGVYRFQLYHDDGWLAPWGGAFGSPVIDVTITE